MSPIETFIKSFADPSALKDALMQRDSLGETCLHHYAIERDAEAVALIIGAGVDINARDNFGSTPLASAALLDDNEEVVAVLMKHGADPTVHDRTDTTVLENLKILKRDKMIALIHSFIKTGS
jgi:ankyrin repeat protein